MVKRIRAMVDAENDRALIEAGISEKLVSLISTGTVPPEGLQCLDVLSVKELSIPLLAQFSVVLEQLRQKTDTETEVSNELKERNDLIKVRAAKAIESLKKLYQRIAALTN
jgi:hypothetical protein